MNTITEVTENIRNSIKVLREKVVNSQHGSVSNGKCQNWRREVSPNPEEKRRYFINFNEYTALKCLICFSSTIGICKIIGQHGLSKNFQLLDLVTVPAATYAFICHVIVEYSWLLIPAVIGILISFVTWFVVYHDSRIPGIDPPSPFSPRFNNKLPSLSLSSGYLFALSIGIIVFLVLVFSGMLIST